MRIATVVSAAVVLPVFAAVAGAPTFELGTLYQCPNGQSFKVMACAGPAAADWCDVQSFQGGQPLMRGKSQRVQILALMPRCSAGQPQAVANAQAAAPAGVERAYHLHDKVQVNAQGVGWMDGEIISIADGIETEYKVAVSGNRFLLASYHDLRFVKAAPAAP
jgi:hypothetical protein